MDVSTFSRIYLKYFISILFPLLVKFNDKLHDAVMISHPPQASSQLERKRDFEKIFAHYDVVRFFLTFNSLCINLSRLTIYYFINRTFCLLLSMSITLDTYPDVPSLSGWFWF